MPSTLYCSAVLSEPRLEFAEVLRLSCGPFSAADEFTSNPFNMPDCDRKLNGLPLITGDKTEMADIEIVVRPDGKNWLLGTGTAGKVRPLRGCF